MNLLELAINRGMEIKDFQGNSYEFNGSFYELTIRKEQRKFEDEIVALLIQIGWIKGASIKFATQSNGHRYADHIERVQWSLLGIAEPKVGEKKEYYNHLPLHSLMFPVTADILQDM